MSVQTRIVLDANILLRAVLGVRVREILETYEGSVFFYSPDSCFAEARRYIPDLAQRRHFDAAFGLDLLHHVSSVVEAISEDVYETYKEVAIARIGVRDVEDWPVLATAMLLDCPIWTEDHDFFGSGVATWTTSNIELYMRKG